MDPVSDEYILSTAWRRWGITPKKVTSAEWASSCPQCGGKDRFRIFQNDGGFWCRAGDGHCGIKGWLDDDDKEKFKPDPKWKENQLAREQAARAERQTIVQKWQASHRAGYWKGWHENVGERQREWFHKRGIIDEWIAKYKLGYCAEKHIEGGHIFPAYTIPIFSPVDGSIVNVHFRLELPIDLSPEMEKEIGGKYRYEYVKDEKMPAAAWYALKHGVSKSAIVVEGAFKAMVVFETFAKELGIQVIGLPSATPHPFLFDEIYENYRQGTWIWMDPGAHEAAKRIAGLLQNQKTRIVQTAWKPDDAILYHSRGPASVQAWLNQSKPTFTIARPKANAFQHASI